MHVQGTNEAGLAKSSHEAGSGLLTSLASGLPRPYFVDHVQSAAFNPGMGLLDNGDATGGDAAVL